MNASSGRSDVARLEQICEAAVRAVGYELVDLEYGRAPHGWVLRVFIDHVHGDEPARRGDAPRRISHEDCRRASDQLGTCLDVEDPLADAYALEVSSPGVYRRVRKERDFRRFMGFRVRVKTREPVAGRRNFMGEIAEVGADVVRIKDGDRIWELPLAGISKAELAEEY